MLKVSSSLKNIVVGAGGVHFLSAGQKGLMKAPHLTVCCAILLKGFDKKGTFKGYLMGHRQPIDHVFDANLRITIKDQCPDLRWEIIAVQHANSTVVEGPTGGDTDSVSSVDGVATDVSRLLNVSESDIRKMAEKGPEQTFGVNQMIVEIDETGKETVQRRVKKFYECTIM